MRQIDRKDFLKLSITIVSTTAGVAACGDEEPVPTGTGGTGMTGGTAGDGMTGGTAGDGMTGGTAGDGMTGGTAGDGMTGGSGGTTAGSGGSGGAMAGSGGDAAGSGGSPGGSGGAGGADGGMAGGGNGGAMAGSGGGGMSGNGGAAGGGGGMCMMGDFGIMQTSNENHDHLPLSNMGMSSAMTFVASINAGMAFTFTVPSDNMHTHTLMFTADECMTLRNGGSITGKVSSEDGDHTHTYTIECMA